MHELFSWSAKSSVTWAVSQGIFHLYSGQGTGGFCLVSVWILVTQAGKRELEGHWVGLRVIGQDMTHTFPFPLARDGHMNPPNHRSWIMWMCMDNHMDVRRALPVATAVVDSFWVVSAFYHPICRSWAGCQLTMLCSSCFQPMRKLSVLLVPPRAWGCVYSSPYLFHTPLPFAHFFWQQRCSVLYTTLVLRRMTFSGITTILENQPNASGPTLTNGRWWARTSRMMGKKWLRCLWPRCSQACLFWALHLRS